MIEDGKMREMQNERATFVVKVMFRQHSSLQGQVTWVEKKQMKKFKSEMELMRLIDDTKSGSDWDEAAQVG